MTNIAYVNTLRLYVDAGFLEPYHELGYRRTQEDGTERIHLGFHHGGIATPRQAPVEEILALLTDAGGSAQLCSCADFVQSPLNGLVPDAGAEVSAWLTGFTFLGRDLDRLADLNQLLTERPARCGIDALDAAVDQVSAHAQAEVEQLRATDRYVERRALDLMQGVRQWSTADGVYRYRRVLGPVPDAPAPGLPSWETRPGSTSDPVATIAALEAPFVWLRTAGSHGETVWRHLTDAHPAGIGRLPVALLCGTSLPSGYVLGIDAGFTADEVAAAAAILQPGVPLADLVAALHATS